MLYHTIYAHWNFGTWNCWNANLSNGFYICCILELGLYMVYIYVVSYYIWHWNFGTWNCWNANLSNGFYMVYPTIYCFGTWNYIFIYMLYFLELGTAGTQIYMVYIYVVSYYIWIEILELGTVGTQI